MARMTAEQEAQYALDFGIARSDLPENAQLAYDRLAEQRARTPTPAPVPRTDTEDPTHYAVSNPQRLVLSHRMNFWGRPTGLGKVSWYYKGTRHVVPRPDDGQAAREWQARCGVCGQELKFTVYSVQETRLRAARRLRTRREWRATGLAVTTVLVICCIAVGGADFPLIIALIVFGVLVTFTTAPDPASETGIILQRDSLGKHSVRPEISRPADRPILVCPQCGHREDYLWSPALREHYVEEKYQAAKKRLEAHISMRHG